MEVAHLLTVEQAQMVEGVGVPVLQCPVPVLVIEQLLLALDNTDTTAHSLHIHHTQHTDQRQGFAGSMLPIAEHTDQFRRHLHRPQHWHCRQVIVRFDVRHNHRSRLAHPVHPAHPATLMLIIGVLVVIIASRVAIGCLRCATSIGLSGRASSPLERRETGIARPSLMRAVRLSVRAEGEGGLHLDAPLHRPRKSHDQHPRSSEPRLQRPRRSMQPSPKLVARLLDSNGVLGC